MKRKTPDAGLSANVKENIDSIAEFYEREEEKITGSQSVIEEISRFFSSPIYFVSFILFVVGWILFNITVFRMEGKSFDDPPFIWLQGIVALNGVLITIAVLIRQNRMARLAELHAHLNLQVNLLAEQKTTKIIKLLEELRRDSPDVKDRRDLEVESMQIQTDPHAVLKEIEKHHTETKDMLK